MCGRTLFGAAPSKGQELEEHYFGAIRPTVNEFMKELDEELWKLGVSAKTKHNEVAPAQHELAPIFTNANRAVDENLLTMEMMRLLASHHGLVCLLREKPFEGIKRLRQAQQLVPDFRRRHHHPHRGAVRARLRAPEQGRPRDEAREGSRVITMARAPHDDEEEISAVEDDGTAEEGMTEDASAEDEAPEITTEES